MFTEIPCTAAYGVVDFITSDRRFHLTRYILLPLLRLTTPSDRSDAYKSHALSRFRRVVFALKLAVKEQKNKHDYSRGCGEFRWTGQKKKKKTNSRGSTTCSLSRSLRPLFSPVFCTCIQIQKYYYKRARGIYLNRRGIHQTADTKGKTEVVAEIYL